MFTYAQVAENMGNSAKIRPWHCLTVANRKECSTLEGPRPQNRLRLTGSEMSENQSHGLPMEQFELNFSCVSPFFGHYGYMWNIRM